MSISEMAEHMLLLIPALLIALTVHEFCHGYAAYKLGDKTAKWDGRLSFNPIRHIDPFGFLMILVVGFGWAKPVMVNPHNLRNPKKDMAIIAFAGPLSNFVAAFFTLLIFRIIIEFNLLPYHEISFYVLRIIFNLYSINVVLGLFNLIPIPPLDGSKILGAFLPYHLYFRYMNFRYWFPVLLVLLVTGLFGIIISPVAMTIATVYDLIIGLFLSLFR